MCIRDQCEGSRRGGARCLRKPVLTPVPVPCRVDFLLRPPKSAAAVLRLRGRTMVGATFVVVVDDYLVRLRQGGGQLFLSGIDPEPWAQLNRFDRFATAEDFHLQKADAKLGPSPQGHTRKRSPGSRRETPTPAKDCIIDGPELIPTRRDRVPHQDVDNDDDHRPDRTCESPPQVPGTGLNRPKPKTKHMSEEKVWPSAAPSITKRSRSCTPMTCTRI